MDDNSGHLDYSVGTVWSASATVDGFFDGDDPECSPEHDEPFINDDGGGPEAVDAEAAGSSAALRVAEESERPLSSLYEEPPAMSNNQIRKAIQGGQNKGRSFEATLRTKYEMAMKNTIRWDEKAARADPDILNKARDGVEPAVMRN